MKVFIVPASGFCPMSLPHGDRVIVTLKMIYTVRKLILMLVK